MDSPTALQLSLSPDLEREVAKLLQALTLATLRAIAANDAAVERLEKVVEDLRAAQDEQVRHLTAHAQQLKNLSQSQSPPPPTPAGAPAPGA